MNDHLSTVISAVQGLIVRNPGGGRQGEARPALYVRFDIRASTPYDEETGSIPRVACVDLHMIVTAPHHVFFSTVEEGWVRPPLNTFRCVSAHDSCWRSGLETYVRGKVCKAVCTSYADETSRRYALSRDGLYTSTKWEMLQVRMHSTLRPEEEALGYYDRYTLSCK